MKHVFSWARLAMLTACLLLNGCGGIQGKPGPGSQATYDRGVLGDGRSIEENRKVGVPGSD